MIEKTARDMEKAGKCKKKDTDLVRGIEELVFLFMTYTVGKYGTYGYHLGGNKDREKKK